MNHLQPQSDQLWQYPKRREICRQYVQGHCNYGNKCKYEHPPSNNTQPQPVGTSHMNRNGEIWTSFPGVTMPQFEGYHNDASQSPYQYSTATRLLSNGTLVHPPHTTSLNHESAEQLTVDQKKTNAIIARKTTACKHFVRNNGYCPMGNSCNFVHDISLVRSIMHNRNISIQSGDSSGSDRQGVSSHCWAYVQGGCRARQCRYLHPGDVEPYKKYTPCPHWRLCPDWSTGMCPFKHPEPEENAHASGPSMSVVLSPPPHPPPLMQPFYPPPPPVAYPPIAPTKPDPIEVNGTTYFPIAPFENMATEDHNSYPEHPVAIPIPLATPIPGTYGEPSFLPMQFMPAPMSPPPSYQHAPHAYPPHFCEQPYCDYSYVRDPSPIPFTLPPMASMFLPVAEYERMGQWGPPPDEQFNAQWHPLPNATLGHWDPPSNESLIQPEPILDERVVINPEPNPDERLVAGPEASVAEEFEGAHVGLEPTETCTVGAEPGPVRKCLSYTVTQPEPVERCLSYTQPEPVERCLSYAELEPIERCQSYVDVGPNQRRATCPELSSTGTRTPYAEPNPTEVLTKSNSEEKMNFKSSVDETLPEEPWLLHSDENKRVLYSEPLPMTDGLSVAIPITSTSAPRIETIDNSAEPKALIPKAKRRFNTGHVRRISINIKTGEVVECTGERRHGVYSL